MDGYRHAKLLGIGGLFIVAALIVGILACLRPARAEKTVRPPEASTAATRPGHPLPRVTSGTIPPPDSPGTAGLRTLTPVQEYNISNIRTGPVRIGGVTYPDSVQFTCDSGASDSAGDLDYAVSGFGSLTAVVGIPDADVRAVDDTMTVTFLNNGSASQAAAPITISPGHPRSVHVAFRDSSQLVISCSATNAEGRAEYTRLALGNATVARAP